MKKIAHLQLLPLLSGVQRVCLDELQRLDPSLYDRYLICREPGLLTAEAERSGIKCLYVPALQRSISLKNDMAAFIALFRLFRKYNFDIVHTHSSKTGVLGRIAAFISGTKLIVHTVHGFSFPAARSKFEYFIFFLMEKLGSLCGDRLICLHTSDRDIAVNKLGVSPDKIVILPNGIDLHKFHPSSLQEREEIRAELSIPAASIVVGMTGRLWPQKNPGLLLDSAIRLLHKNADLVFVFIGDGELLAELKSKSEASGFSSRILFLGWRQDTDRLLHALDVFVLPSLWEGMPLAILEAQSSGLPCVVSDIQGNNSLVKHGTDGFLFSLSAPQSIDHFLSRLIAEPELRQQFGIASRAKVEANHDLSSRSDKIMRLYERS